MLIDSIHKLTETEKKAVEAGLEDIKNGKVVSSEKANELIREWLKKIVWTETSVKIYRFWLLHNQS